MDEKNDESAKLDEFFTRYNAGRHIALYRRERNGLLIWRAFAEYRRAGLPVPDNIMAKLDEWAVALEGAWNDTQVANAIEMGTVKAKPAKVRLRGAEKARNILEQLTIREDELGQKPNAAARATAADFNLKFGNVKTIKSRWNAPDASSADEPSPAPGSDLQTAWVTPLPKVT